MLTTARVAKDNRNGSHFLACGFHSGCHFSVGLFVLVVLVELLFRPLAMSDEVLELFQAAVPILAAGLDNRSPALWEG